MPSALGSTDVLYLSTKEILQFSENWRSLYRPFPWPAMPPGDAKHTTGAREFSPREDNKTPTVSKHCSPVELSGCEIRTAYPCTYTTTSECLVTSNFTPNNHSTPNNKLSKKGENFRKWSREDSSVEAMSFSTTYPDTSLSAERCPSESFTCHRSSSDSIHQIPSISRAVDEDYTNKYTCKEIYCERDRDRRIRKSGIKGVRCIVSFALTDDPVKKRTQIQACSISVMILAIVTISFVLVYFASNKYSFTSVTVPTLPSNSSELLRTTSSTIRLPILQLPYDTPTTVSLTTTEFMNDAPMNDIEVTTSPISRVIQKLQKNIKPYPKLPRRGESTTTVAGEIQSSNESRDATEELCRQCQKDMKVCMLNEESGIPVCINAADRHDPTGCGGLCALETEACQLVDRARGVRMCRALSSLRCGAQQWRCHNGLCVQRQSRCDGKVDCYDRSDEMHCDCDLSKQFRCGHATSCFPNSKLCDGTVDCWDGRDEINCTNTCPTNEFTCNNGECILSERFCDGFRDCADHSDEPSGCEAGCGENELRCGNRRCVPKTMLCDGVDNCGDKTDERGCP